MVCSSPDNEVMNIRLGKAMMASRNFEVSRCRDIHEADGRTEQKAEEHFLKALHTVVDNSLVSKYRLSAGATFIN